MFQKQAGYPSKGTQMTKHLMNPKFSNSNLPVVLSMMHVHWHHLHHPTIFGQIHHGTVQCISFVEIVISSIYPPPTTKIITCLVRNPYWFSGMPPWNPGSQGSKLYRNDHFHLFFPWNLRCNWKWSGVLQLGSQIFPCREEAVDIQLPCAMLVNGQLIPPYNIGKSL